MTFDEALKGIYKARMGELLKENAQLRAIVACCLLGDGVLSGEDKVWLEKTIGVEGCPTPIVHEDNV